MVNKCSLKETLPVILNDYNPRMRRFWLLLILLLLCSLACRAVIDRLAPATALPATATTSQVLVTQPSPLPGTPAQPVFPTPTASTTPMATPKSAATASPGSFSVRFHPDGPLFVGDQVSLEIIPDEDMDLEGQQVEVRLKDSDMVLGTAGFGLQGIGQRTQATLLWAWDTAGLQPGTYELVFTLQPLGATWSEKQTLLPAALAPSPQARWETVENDCCTVSFIRGTETERDLEELLDLLDTQANEAALLLGTDFETKIPITFLPRVVGHGGFAGREISVSYLDRDYAGGDTGIVLLHEMVHLLDGRFENQQRLSLLVEGLAVYLSGGHFKPEPLLERSAALLPPEEGCVPAQDVISHELQDVSQAPVCGLDRYLPLKGLFDDFYFAQHEIGYLQAGALVEFMVNTWGWEDFELFYRDIQPLQETDGSERQGETSEVVNQALQKHFNLSLDELERRFLVVLEQEPLQAEWVEDVRLTVEYYDTVRDYQRLFDPSAYFLFAWLPDGQEMRERGIVADYARRPSAPENVELETLLVEADSALRQGDYGRAEELLKRVQAYLILAQ
jgi:hypothetical protein